MYMVYDGLSDSGQVFMDGHEKQGPNEERRQDQSKKQSKASLNYILNQENVSLSRILDFVFAGVDLTCQML